MGAVYVNASCKLSRQCTSSVFDIFTLIVIRMFEHGFLLFVVFFSVHIHMILESPILRRQCAAERVNVVRHLRLVVLTYTVQIHIYPLGMVVHRVIQVGRWLLIIFRMLIFVFLCFFSICILRLRIPSVIVDGRCCLILNNLFHNHFLDYLSHYLGRCFRVSAQFLNKLRQVFALIHLGNYLFEYVLLNICEELALFLNLSFNCVEIYDKWRLWGLLNYLWNRFGFFFSELLLDVE
jgi:hypothetical protein